MKKLVLLIVFISLFSILCACASGSSGPANKQSTSDIVGKYVLTKVIEKGGTVLTGEEFDRDEFSISLHEDGTAVMKSESSFYDTLNWTYENGRLYFVSGGQREEISYSGNTITLPANDGDTWIFTKQ